MWDYLKSSKKPIVLYGTGNGADKILDKLNSMSIPVSAIFASDNFVRTQNFRGFLVTTYSQVKERYKDMIVLVCFGSQLHTVIEQIKKINNEQELYAPDVPVFGKDVFDMAYYNLHKEEISKIHSLLADQKSKSVYQNIIKYKLSGKINYLLDCETEKINDFNEILKLNRNEIFMDLGAYRGDTVMEFIDYVKDYKYIYAIEPNKKNFFHLEKNINLLGNCKCINIGIHHRKDLLPFNNKSGRNFCSSIKGDLIPVDSVDNILAQKPVSFIKMDIEGQELNAITGATHTILNYKPKLLISAYHRTEDLFSVPLKVLSIRKDYKVYIRHNPYIPAWDTNFYFI